MFVFVSGEDVWSYAKKLPHLFQQGGVFYNIVKKDMGKQALCYRAGAAVSIYTCAFVCLHHCEPELIIRELLF